MSPLPDPTVGDRHVVGLVVNPIAGMGGRVGLKGTDDVVERAVAMGAVPTAQERAHEALCELRTLLGAARHRIGVDWLTCSGAMGADCLARAGFDRVSIVHEPGPTTTVEDTRQAVRAFLRAEAELIVFCGGDGTARDVCSIAQRTTPILGIPAGVKMYSGVFGVNPASAARIVVDFLHGDLELADVEILDIDEERYRRGEWAVRLHDMASTPYAPSFTQTSKALVSGVGDAEVREAIADDVIERMDTEPDALFVLGPGSTVETIGRRLGIDKTLLGVDAVVGRHQVGTDLDERQLMALLDRHDRCTLVLSPIGAQGFVLGRGNQQLSPEVVARIGPVNIVVVATPAKLQRTPVLRFDTGDRRLDGELARTGYVRVVTGYHVSRLVEVAARDVRR